MLLPVVLAGGIGSRLWPVSRTLLPKQFINFPQYQGSLFQNTLTRLEGLPEISEPLVVCNSEHRFLVAEQVRQLGKTCNRILLEPIGRNTAPAVAIAALQAMNIDPDVSLLVLPADHLIKDKSALHEAIKKGVALARQNKLVTFGIVPSTPEKGYGYIKTGSLIKKIDAYRVADFVEKPDTATAQSYLDSGNYLWNSGMFLFRATDYLHELEKHASDIYSSCKQAFAEIERCADFDLLPEEAFARCRNESIDCAVMEVTKNAVVVPLDASWNDLGAWDALWKIDSKDENGNVINGDVLIEAVSNSYIQAHSRLVTVVGMDDTVIVETPDALLVACKGKVQLVKQIVKQLENAGREEINSHAKVVRPWGYYESLATGNNYQVKHLMVNPGESISLQFHKYRAEHWTVVSGVGLITCDDREFELGVNESTFIPVGSKHRIVNKGEEPVEIIEVQLGDYLGEDDIVRIEDIYGREDRTKT